MKNLLFAFVILNMVITVPFAVTASPVSGPEKVTDIKMLSTFLYAANGNMADGNRVVFSTQYSNQVDGNDAIKIANPGENFGIMRSNKILAVEARQPVAIGDSLPFFFSNVATQTYKMVIVPQNLSEAEANLVLYDRFTNTYFPVSLIDTTRINLTFTTDPASKATNRLAAIFVSSFGTLPVKFTSISAARIGRANIIKWNVSSETNILSYDVEKSLDAYNFISFKTTSPLYHNEVGGGYEVVDEQISTKSVFYRIKSRDHLGEHFSSIVKLDVAIENSRVDIFPNPVVNHTINLSLYNNKSSQLKIQLHSASGQTLFNKVITINTGDINVKISLPRSIPPGVYTLRVFDGIKSLSGICVLK